MGLSVSPNGRLWQSSLLTTPHSPKPLSHRLLSRPPFPFAGFKNLRVQRGERPRSASPGFDDLLDPEIIKLIGEAERAFHESPQSHTPQFLTVTPPDLLEPSQLGIQPHPPTWPERDAMLRMNSAMKLSLRELPLSIRIIKKKLQLPPNLQEATHFTCCSVRTTFSHLLFILHQLQNYALHIRNTLYPEDLKDVMDKFRADMDASFVWLFQKVFCNTPSFMLYTMVLLANFSVYSMGNHALVSFTPTSIVMEAQTLSDIKNKKSFKEADRLWDSIMRRVCDETRTNTWDKKSNIHYVAPGTKEIERNKKYEEYRSTDRYFKRQLRQDPNNSLLLSNYAQFLYLVINDHDEAEKYFRRSVAAEPADAEAFCRYADFLWVVRNDWSAAEVRYLKAIEEGSDTPHYTSKYATFLWSTGAIDTCYPIHPTDASQQL